MKRLPIFKETTKKLIRVRGFSIMDVKVGDEVIYVNESRFGALCYGEKYTVTEISDYPRALLISEEGRVKAWVLTRNFYKVKKAAHKNGK